MQRRKGASAEREVVRLLRKRGFRAERTAPLQSGKVVDSSAPDVTCVPGVHLEVKRQETIKIEAWCRQAEADCGENVPVVVWRRSNQPWRVTLPLEDYLDLLGKGQDERER